MKAFLVHRTPKLNEAKEFLFSLRHSDGIYIDVVFLKKSFGSKWEQQAESKIQSCEVVIVYDIESCNESENTLWEVERAKELGKPVIGLTKNDISEKNIGDILSAYEFSSEFEECFNEPQNTSQLLELYKIMVDSSEQLIQRRQITNGFFITIIGFIVGAIGFVIKEKILIDSGILVLIFPIVIGLLMCRSWKNLIENYGKLNTGKFKVIHRIENTLDAKIFAAEWVALGKGFRKEKYQSFTSTEQNVPKLFSYLLWIAMVMTLLIADWEPVIDYLSSTINNIKMLVSVLGTYWPL